MPQTLLSSPFYKQGNQGSEMLVNLPTITQLLHGKAQVRIKSQLFIMMVQSLTIRSCHYQLHFNDSQVPSMLKSSLYMESLASTDKERSSRDMFPGTTSHSVFINRKLDPRESTERPSVLFALAALIHDKMKVVSIQKGWTPHVPVWGASNSIDLNSKNRPLFHSKSKGGRGMPISCFLA